MRMKILNITNSKDELVTELFERFLKTKSKIQASNPKKITNYDVLDLLLKNFGG